MNFSKKLSWVGLTISIICFSITFALQRQIALANPPKNNEEILEEYMKDVAFLLHTARYTFPVKSVRNDLEEILTGVDEETVEIRMVLSDPIGKTASRLTYSSDGRPVFIFYVESVEGIARKLYRESNGSKEKTDRALMDWLVVTTSLNWTRHKFHYLDNCPSYEAATEQESAVWKQVTETVIIPGRQMGRFVSKEDEETYNAFECYMKAKGKTEHDAWGAFVKWACFGDVGIDLDMLILEACYG